MKTALITTTINIPRVLDLYRALGPDVQFFIAGDEKTPTALEVAAPANTRYLSPQIQRGFGYKCSELLGWNTDARRNIALLEALKWGADVIVTVDDDNIPVDEDYFVAINSVFEPSPLWRARSPFAGIKVESRTGWFDQGQLLSPTGKQRGFPISFSSDYSVTHTTNAKVGVAAGLVLGDPDISAIERIATKPTITQVNELGRAGVVTDSLTTYAPFNSQNTAFIRELAPAMFIMPGSGSATNGGFGRNCDIAASLICQRIMRHKGYHVHFGQPFVYQQRNKHNLLNDLKGEMYAMENIQALARELDNWGSNSEQSVIDAVRFFYSASKVIPEPAKAAAVAWCEDCESVL